MTKWKGMSDMVPVTAEVWMRLEGSDNMSQVGTVTYTEVEIFNGVLSTESFQASIEEFVQAVNEILRTQAAQL